MLRPVYEPRARKSRPGTWTDERIVAALRDWFETFGETPLSYEWSPRASRLLAVPHGRSADWVRQYPRWPSTATVCKHFGLWRTAVDAAGLPPARAIAPGRGLAERIEAARRLSTDSVGTAEIASLLEVSPRTVRDYLRAGSCRDCGAPVVTAERCRRCAARRAGPPRWTRAAVRHAIRAWAASEGSAPTTEDWTPTPDVTRKWGREYPRWPSYVTVVTLFGGFGKAIEAAGLRPSRRRWSRETIAAAFRTFIAAHGRSPSSADLDREPDLPSPPTVRAHFGSLAAAREFAGECRKRKNPLGERVH